MKDNCGGSVVFDRVAFESSPPKSLGGGPKPEHTGAQTLWDGPKGNSVADCFALLTHHKPCSLAAAVAALPLPQEIGTTIAWVPRFTARTRTSNQGSSSSIGEKTK